jgi:hypothetical protein
VNASGGSTQVKKAYAVNASGGSTQVKKGYSINSSGGSTLVYASEETVLSGASATTPNNSGAYNYQEATMTAFTVNTTDYPSLRISGTYGTVVYGTGEYGTYGTTLELQYYNGSAWKTLRKAANMGEMSSPRNSIGEAVGGSNIAGTYTSNINTTVTLNNLYELGSASKHTFTGNVQFRLFIWCRTAAAATSAAIRGTASNMTVVAVA